MHGKVSTVMRSEQALFNSRVKNDIYFYLNFSFLKNVCVITRGMH